MTAVNHAVAALFERDAMAIAGVEKLRFFPLAITGGQGCWLIEAGGRRLLDLSASWAANGLGHGHPAIVAAVTRAIASAPGASCLSAVHPGVVELAETLLALTPGRGERSVYIGLTGTDANEAALAACRHHSGRRRVIAFAKGYHGGFGTAKRVSGVHVEAGTPPDADSVLLPYPTPYRNGRTAPGGAQAEMTRALEAVQAELVRGDVACIIVEPILSDGGMVVPPEGFLRGLTELADAHGAFLICDEVKVGLGRSGTLHAFERDGVVPHLVSFGKSLGGGLPLSAVVGPREVLAEPASSAMLTLAGNPVSVAAGLAVLRTVVEQRLPDRAAAAGDRFRQRLRAALSDVPEVGDIRGAGLAIGVELVRGEDAASGAALARATVYRAWELGAVFYYVGGNVLELTPPLIITDDEIDQGVEIIARAIRDAVTGAVDMTEVARFTGW